MKKKNIYTWSTWIVLTILGSGFLLVVLTGKDEDKKLYLIGKVTHGHHQIEMACSSCHTDPFGGKEIIQKACVSCHEEELKKVEDSHPKSKFTDPRNADRVAILDARYCVTCHQEHRPGSTRKMGVTLPDDYCFRCHQDVADDRPSHKGAKFDSCATAGCHNYHDNKALYEDFLVKHARQPKILTNPLNYARDRGWAKPIVANRKKPLTLKDIDAPSVKTQDQTMMDHWAMTAHARQGINCKDCHQPSSGNRPQNTTGWIDKPGYQVCASCHKGETRGFLEGKHGMRLKAKLSPMKVKDARIFMKKDAGHKTLGCNSCHKAHEYNTRYASVKACVQCHDDQHTRAYQASPHYRLWQKEVRGEGKPGSGVSCATCHLPREQHDSGNTKSTRVQHNQNLNLRPNEKMIRGVCMQCHGLPFSIDALADKKLIKNNFRGHPSVHIPSVDWATQRIRKKTDK